MSSCTKVRLLVNLQKLIHHCQCRNIPAGSLLANLMMLAGSPNALQQKNAVGSSSSHTGSPLGSLATIVGSGSHTSNLSTTAGAMIGGQNTPAGSLLGNFMLQTGSLAENLSMKTGSMSGCTIQTLLDNLRTQTVPCDDQQSKKTVPVCAQSVQTGSLLEIWFGRMFHHWAISRG